MSALITNIRQNTEYFCKKAMESFEKQDVLASIKYLNEAEKVANSKEIYEIYFIQGLMYAKLQDYKRSNEYFLLSIFSYPLQIKAFMSICENMLALKNIELAQNYKAILDFHPIAKKDEANTLDALIKKVEKQLAPKIREYKVEDTEEFIKDYELSLKLFVSGDEIDDVLDLMSKYDYKKVSKAKDILTKYYCIKGDFDKAEDIAKSSKLSTVDKCNLIFVYHFTDQKEKRDLLINDLLEDKTLSLDEKQHFGIELAKIEENLLSIKVLEEYLKKNPYDSLTNMAYSMICMDSELFTKAKDCLLKFLPTANFDIGVYEELLNRCEKRQPASFVNNTQTSNLINKKYRSKLKWLVELDQEEFEKNVKDCYKEMMWLATSNDRYLKSMFFVKYAKINANYNIINKILVSDDVDINTKKIIIRQRFDNHINQNIVYTIDQMFVAFTALDKKLANDNMYFKVYSLLCSRVMDSKERGLFDFSIFINNFSKKYKDLDNPYIMAAIISWEIDKSINRKSIKAVCKYYQISEEDFWKYYKGD